MKRRERFFVSLSLLLCLNQFVRAEEFSFKDNIKTSSLNINGKEYDHVTAWIDATFINSVSQNFSVDTKLQLVTEMNTDEVGGCGMINAYITKGKALFFDPSYFLGFLKECTVPELANRLHAMGFSFAILTYPICLGGVGEKNCENLIGSDESDLVDISSSYHNYFEVISNLERISKVTSRIPIAVLSRTDATTLRNELKSENNLNFKFNLQPVGTTNTLVLVDPVIQIQQNFQLFEQSSLSKMIFIAKKVGWTTSYVVGYDFNQPEECEQEGGDEDWICSHCEPNQKICRHGFGSWKGKEVIEEALFREILFKNATSEEDIDAFFKYTFDMESCTETLKKCRDTMLGKDRGFKPEAQVHLEKLQGGSTKIVLNGKIVSDFSPSAKENLVQVFCSSLDYDAIPKNMKGTVYEICPRQGAAKKESGIPFEMVFLVIVLLGLLFVGYTMISPKKNNGKFDTRSEASETVIDESFTTSKAVNLS